MEGGGLFVARASNGITFLSDLLRPLRRQLATPASHWHQGGSVSCGTGVINPA